MMKKLLILSIAFALGSGISTFAQETEAAPYSNGQPATENSNALFDLLTLVDAGTSTGTNGLAAVIYFNDQYITTRWDATMSEDFYRLDSGGVLIETFQIPGVAGVRSITTNGTSLFMGTAGAVIYEIDPGSMTIDNTINITSSAAARMLTYDETLDGGNGGFWIGSFSNDIASIDMDGNELSVIPAATHQTVVYGGAIDNVSPGGPFLWIHDQTGTAPSRDFVTQLNATTGVPTGVVYDFSADGFASGATDVLAGGLAITDEIDGHNGLALVGMCQCTPSNLIFAVELTPSLGVSDNSNSNFSIYPNPANGKVNINTSIAGEKQVVVYDLLGKQVINTTTNGELNISALKSGVYLVSITQNETTATVKLVVQ
ncbi:T9SS type A sorting domain-containing protein [Aequorivita soesokkakensis]|jgi:hypothetical protein|uniref:T9SS type A sorting domain-containing protein n=1 Tax=Aequorivita soesokkakensis TaxID=1385699 RepID=UPI001F60ED63|nr:T9SS type A sorting domain-containing protein [Aequorivita soesokkakensis]